MLIRRYPVLFAIDEVHSLFSVSTYRSPSYELIEPYHLSTPRLALDYLTGIKTFVRTKSSRWRVGADARLEA